MNWLPYPDFKPLKTDRYTDFAELYPNANYNGREGCPRYIPDIMNWDGEKFFFLNEKHRPRYWCRLPKIPGSGEE